MGSAEIEAGEIADEATAATGSSATISISTIVAYLFFNAKAIRRLAGSRRTLVVGLLLVVSAGFAREYDGEYLVAQPWHIALPLIASLIGCTVMVAVVAFAARIRSATVPATEIFLAFLGLYWMTAPMAWLYAIPMERFLSPAEATRANLTLLAIVAIWRVALMTRCVQVLFQTSVYSAFVPIILFSDAVALVALRVVPGPIFAIMGGVRLTESEEVILATRFLLGFLGVLTLPVWLVSYAILCGRKQSQPWRWYRATGAAEGQTSGISTGVWIAVAVALLIWIPVLPMTQAEQRLRWQADRAIRGGDYRAASRLSHRHRAERFPPHWDPPPRAGYGERQPPIYEVAAGLLANDAAPWLIERYAVKLAAEAQARRHFWYDVEQYSDEQLQTYIDTLARLPNSTTIAEPYDHMTDQLLKQNGLTESRRESLQKLRRLAKAKVKEPDS